MKARTRTVTAIILVAIITLAGLYFYTQTSGFRCTETGNIALGSAKLSTSNGYNSVLFSVCNGTNKQINWIGASVNSQQFFSTGPEWAHEANGTYLEGLSTNFVSLGQLLTTQQVCSFTFSGWAYDAGMAGNQGMILNGVADNSTNSTGIVDVAYNDSQVYFQLSNMNFHPIGTQSGVRNIGYAQGDFKDKWTFLTIVLDNGQTSGYVNGSQVWSGKDAGCMTLQAYAFGGQQFSIFNGEIKNVSFYSTALSPSEIENIYAGQSVSAGLVGYWRVNDGHGCTVMDSSGNSNNGVIQGCVSIPPGMLYNPNPVSGQNQPFPLEQGISLTAGQQANLTIAVQFSDGTTSQVSASITVH